MNQYFVADMYNYIVTFVGFVIHLFFVFKLTYFVMPSRYCLNNKKEIVYYPSVNTIGYVVTPEQMKKCLAVWKRLVFPFTLNMFNIKKDIEKIIEKNEKVTTPFPVSLLWKNSAPKITWNFISSWFVVAIVLILISFFIKAYFASGLMVVLLMYPLLPILIKLMGKFAK